VHFTLNEGCRAEDLPCSLQAGEAGDDPTGFLFRIFRRGQG